MRNFASFATPYVIGFFVIGLGWGMWSKKSMQDQMRNTPPLRVLCAENWISQSALEKFSRQRGVPVQLFTYTRPNELLRQMANSGGRIDVVCTSSLLLKSMVQSQWLAKADYSSLPNTQLLSVDFMHLPYDSAAQYSVPLFWNLYGFFGKNAVDEKHLMTWKQTWNSKRVKVWGEELNLLHTMVRSGVRVTGQLEQEHSKNLEEEARAFVKGATKILQPDLAPFSAEAMVSGTDWILLPLGRVARLLGTNSPYHFWLPEDGGAVEVGLLAIGSKSANMDLAKELINELLTTEHALEIHRRLGTGAVHATLNSMDSVAPLQKAQALRSFPLHRFTFPDLDVESLPRFQKIYDQAVSDRQQ